MKIYTDYLTALSECGNDYNDDVYAKNIVEKNRIVRDNLNNPQCILTTDYFEYLLPLSISFKDCGNNVLDFGGGGGYMYFLTKKLFGDSKIAHWNIVDTANLVSKAKPVLSDGKLDFYDNIVQANNNNIDIVIASGSLQAVPYPLQMLNKLLIINAPYFYFCRTPLVFDDKAFAIIHEAMLSDCGPGELPAGFHNRTFHCPISIVNGDEFFKIILEKYNVKFIFVDHGLHQGHTVFPTFGGLFYKKQ